VIKKQNLLLIIILKSTTTVESQWTKHSKHNCVSLSYNEFRRMFHKNGSYQNTSIHSAGII